MQTHSQGYPQPYQQPYGGGYGPAAPPPQVVQQVVMVQQAPATVVVKAPFNHGLHALITLLTCGLWLPVWIILAILH